MKRAKTGFILSLIAGIIILINAVLLAGVAGFFESLSAVFPIFLMEIFTGLVSIGLVFGGLVIVGAILIYLPRKETVGGIIVIIFSILSIIIGGGFIIGLILGIIGGLLGLAKK